MEKLTFAGVTLESEPKEKFLDHFKEVEICDGEAWYRSKKGFHHDEEDFEFDYYYAVHVSNWDEFCEPTEGQPNIIVTLTLVVNPSCWTEKKRKNLLDFAGGSEDKIDDLWASVICVYGAGCVDMGIATYTDHETTYIEDIVESEQCQKILYAIANTFQTIDRMRGFYIDRPWNRIGNTGWDMIHAAIDGSDFVKLALDRYNEQQNS